MTDIIIPVFNQSKITVECLESIRKHTKNYRLIWVDNGSTYTERKTILNELKNHKNYLTIWIDKNSGFVKAVNIGLKEANSKYVVVMNNDTKVTKNWLTDLIEPMQKDENIAITGPITDTDDSWQGWRNVKEKLIKDLPDLTDKNKDECAKVLKYLKGKYYNVGMVAFFCSVFRRSLFDKIGYLDERFGLGLGDDDAICYKTKKTGMRIAFLPNVFVSHKHRTTFKSLYKKEKLEKIQTQNIELFLSLRDNNLL